MNIDIATEYAASNPEFKQWLESTKALRDALITDVYSGPLYSCEPNELADEILEYSGIRVGATHWGSGVDIEDMLGVHPIRAALVRDIESMDLPSYYEPDSGCFMDREPQSEFIEDADAEFDKDQGMNGYWSEPMPYYELSLSDWFESLFSRSTWRDITPKPGVIRLP